jgi:hypothetical protein
MAQAYNQLQARVYEHSAHVGKFVVVGPSLERGFCLVYSLDARRFHRLLTILAEASSPTCHNRAWLHDEILEHYKIVNHDYVHGRNFMGSTRALVDDCHALIGPVAKFREGFVLDEQTVERCDYCECDRNVVDRICPSCVMSWEKKLCRMGAEPSNFKQSFVREWNEWNE